MAKTHSLTLKNRNSTKFRAYPELDYIQTHEEPSSYVNMQGTIPPPLSLKSGTYQS